MFDQELVKTAVQFGLSGLILALIVRPVFMWFMRRADSKDVYIEKLIENHFQRDQETHTKLIRAIEELPNKIVESIAKIYDPHTYEKGGEAYKKILKD